MGNVNNTKWVKSRLVLISNASKKLIIVD